eukprot:365766-Chlamydomonas_euryale.AAC.6
MMTCAIVGCRRPARGCWAFPPSSCGGPALLVAAAGGCGRQPWHDSGVDSSSIRWLQHTCCFWQQHLLAAHVQQCRSGGCSTLSACAAASRWCALQLRDRAI